MIRDKEMHPDEPRVCKSFKENRGMPWKPLGEPASAAKTSRPVLREEPKAKPLPAGQRSLWEYEAEASP